MIKIYNGITIDMSTSEVVDHGAVTFVNDSEVTQLKGGQTQTTTSGYDNPYMDKLFATGADLYGSGKLGQVAEFNEPQLKAHTIGAGAAGRQAGLEQSLINNSNTYTGGLEQGALRDAYTALGGINRNASALGQLGGGRQALNTAGLQMDLGAKLGGLRQQGQQQNFQNLGTALQAQGTGARTLAGIGGGIQGQNQKQLDAPYTAWRQILGPLSSIADKKSTTKQSGGK